MHAEGGERVNEQKGGREENIVRAGLWSENGRFFFFPELRPACEIQNATYSFPSVVTTAFKGVSWHRIAFS